MIEHEGTPADGSSWHELDALVLADDRIDLGRVDLAVHCAARIGGRLGIERTPAHVGAYNLELDAALWRWALRTRPGRVIYYSSSAAYPLAWQDGRTELRLEERHLDPAADIVFAPDATYGYTKLVGERMAGEVRADGVPVTVLRPFSGYGSDQSTDYPFGAFVERALLGAGNGEPGVAPFAVWGDGDQARDFVHVDDIVGATLAAAEVGLDGPLNICTGRPVTFNELAAMVCSAAGYTPVLEHDLDKPVGARWRVGSTDELRRLYELTVPLEDGIARAILSERARWEAMA